MTTPLANPQSETLRVELARTQRQLALTQAERDRWKRRVADRGRALKQANEINHTLTRVINERLDH